MLVTTLPPPPGLACNNKQFFLELEQPYLTPPPHPTCNPLHILRNVNKHITVIKYNAWLHLRLCGGRGRGAAWSLQPTHPTQAGGVKSVQIMHYPQKDLRVLEGRVSIRMIREDILRRYNNKYEVFVNSKFCC